MTAEHSSKNGGRRRNEEMKFVFNGADSRGTDSRVGRSFIKQRFVRDLSGRIISVDTRRYSATPEVYNIESALRPGVLDRIVARFGRESDSSGRRPRRRGGKKVVA